ncbi:hypothetical protein [Deinococcus sonorensis]|uniref:Uncharacterized protein n=2 Tax=Deinococcus sonorensis TaxID=309891 RepID=A0AAU7U6F8_9DEIO
MPGTGSSSPHASRYFLAFREVGTYQRHGQLEGVWKDVVSVERLV